MMQKPPSPSSERIVISTNVKFPSLNAWYAGKHWGSRHADKIKFQSIFTRELGEFIGKKYKSIEVEYRYNNRYDVDNTIPAVKIFIDTLRGLGFIADDTPKYVKKVMLTFDKTLKYGESVFIITGIV